MRHLSLLLSLLALGACAKADPCADTGIAKDQALFASQNFVKRELKAPGSAEFPTRFDAEGVSVIAMGQCEFSVRAWADAQNSFGALIRTSYWARVRANGSDYTLLSLDITE